jgi:hypothetical protein
MWERDFESRRDDDRRPHREREFDRPEPPRGPQQQAERLLQVLEQLERRLSSLENRLDRIERRR